MRRCRYTGVQSLLNGVGDKLTDELVEDGLFMVSSELVGNNSFK